MHSSTIIFATLLPTVSTFVPTAGNNLQQYYHYHTTRILATSDMSSEADINIELAKYCADHFGECALDDIDRLRNAEVVHILCSNIFCA